MESYTELWHLKHIQRGSCLNWSKHRIPGSCLPGLALASLSCSMADLLGAPRKPCDLTGKTFQTTMQWKEPWTISILVTSGVWPHLLGQDSSSFFFKFYLFIFREREREGKREGEKHQCVVASHMPLTGDLACNQGTCPDWESNRRPFGSQASTQSTEPHQVWLVSSSLKGILYQRK